MPTTGLELCDAGLLAAVADKNDTKPLAVPDSQGTTDWPGFAYHDEGKFIYGRAAEDMWFVQPRRVAHTFWSKLAHESISTLNIAGRPPSFSELSFFFLREFHRRLVAAGGPPEKIVFAVPGAYLKDEATEDEKVGLLLGMASELSLPLTGIVDMACAALCAPHAPGFNPALPILVVDIHLEGADLTLFNAEERLERRHFLHLPNAGFAHLIKHLTATMGNRFLRQTAFDILEDGRVEQTFYRQTKDFLLSGADEHRYQINTATRNYELIAKHEQLAADSHAFVAGLVHGVQSFIEHSAHSPGLCTVALSARCLPIPGLETALRACGFARLLHLPPGAAAAGAARIGEARWAVPADVADVPVATSVPLSDTRRVAAAAWEVRLQKFRPAAGPRPTPTHAIMDGIGHGISPGGRFIIGAANPRIDLTLPEAFGADDCAVPLHRDGGKLWFVDAAARSDSPAARVPVEAGDRLVFRSGTAAAEILFAHCPAADGSPA